MCSLRKLLSPSSLKLLALEAKFLAVASDVSICDMASLCVDLFAVCSNFSSIKSL